MAKSTFHNAQIGKRLLKLSNLEKSIYKKEGILKAEVIQYYLQIAPTILKYIKGRPLSLIRYPDGIEGEVFYQKNKPDWTPEWIDSVPLGKEETKHYIIADEEATLVWIANLAGLELHIANCRRPNFTKPDVLVFDLDPPEEGWWDQTKTIALSLKEFLELLGYTPFVKTSGNKGLHLFVPIDPSHEYEIVIEILKKIVEEFVAAHKDTCTLNIRKNQRTEKIFIDIQRNHASQTIIAPYSLRGKPTAPVSMPFEWKSLAEIESGKQFNIHNVVDLVKQQGDAWDGFYSKATELHPFRKLTPKKTIPANPEGIKHKSPEQLASYQEKRDFEVSPEPKGELPNEYNTPNAFVIHRHHASRLHYDLRLQIDGVLRCWAVPRGMPDQPGIKRMAVETEPHPIQYLHFEGVIPKGEYGGGPMWIFAQGRFEITKPKKDGFYFRLYSAELEGEFRMHNTKGKEWLLERVDRSQWDRKTLIEPMLATAASEIPASSDQYLYEVKWDGIRVILYIDEEGIKILSRSGRDITAQFPEMVKARDNLNVTVAILDAEIVCLDAKGIPVFKDVISRMHAGSFAIDTVRKSKPAFCYIFDIMYLDGRHLLREPLMRRQEWIKDIIKSKTVFRSSDVFTDGPKLWKAAEQLKLEGVMAKRKDSIYTPGKRSSDWLKIKFRTTMECLIVGYTYGKGDREKHFGSLQLVSKGEDGTYTYRGRVGSGFDEAMLLEIRKNVLDPIVTSSKQVEIQMEEEKNTVWLKPERHCEIQYASITPNETLREPVFVQFRPDLD
ncbi:MAG: non-homologous end-joining DNA ligase [Saprospiraceae bacterium]|jgi:DNA ligase D-like protein (predicted ligase)/DNA ligase D-like protein (predicted polymerase)/DNA ligase D-like protein (predicted 3'-phosphoesterase)|nr:non-homologous end-joining DNA ligase [Saprospiraceae bacterium]MBK6481410.1 non-homologous end-joining DNA ligase [Saprospiraceae bacterium]MBK6815882.1 non-homologous end-joining DNA ligase [Saprospiraceae bacterium]MBK8511576.1 non-homologous end-joining DNA ligase [Saprospiraceae bacterium]MBP7802599.1 non-homologous end-joining DNA ligase [Saprospiraceae bacterium]